MPQQPSKTPRVRRTQRERRETTRANLLAAAVRCIGRDGYGPTTLTKVAEEAGLTKGAVQHHFKDKSALMHAVVETGWAQILPRLISLSAEGTVAERLDTVIGYWIDVYANPAWEAAIEVSSVGAADPVLRDRNRALYRECRIIIERSWARVFADAPVPPARVREAGRLAFAMLSGIRSDLDSKPDFDDVFTDLATMKEMTYHLLTTPPGDGPFSSRKRGATS